MSLLIQQFSLNFHQILSGFIMLLAYPPDIAGVVVENLIGANTIEQVIDSGPLRKQIWMKVGKRIKSRQNFSTRTIWTRIVSYFSLGKAI